MPSRRLIAGLAGRLVAVLAAAAIAGCGADEEPAPVAPSGTAATTTAAPATTTAAPPAATIDAPEQPPDDRRRLGAAEALGQTIVAGYDGPTPPASLLARIRRGQVGSVILFADNVAQPPAAIRASIGRLHRAARAGGRPKVLVMIDQEGGIVKRLPGPPSRSAAAMRSPRAEGVATGRMLRRLGITIDLAPVADVAHPGTFLDSRAFGTSPAAVARRACAFADGLQRASVAATLKHFPGLGHARINTDDAPADVTLGADVLRRDYAAYRACGTRPGTLVMLSSAAYPKLTGPAPAVLERRAYREIPRANAWPVTISDALEGGALRRHRTPARRALNAGLDMLLYGTPADSARAYPVLLADVRAGRIPQRRVEEAANRVLRLKAYLAAGG